MQIGRLLLGVSLMSLCVSVIPARAEPWLGFRTDETKMTYTAAMRAVTIVDIGESALQGSLSASAVHVDSVRITGAADSDCLMSLDLLSLHFIVPGTDLDTFCEDDRTGGGEVNLEVAPIPTAVLLGLLGLTVAGLKLRNYA